MVVLPLPVIACAVWAKRLFHVTDDLLGAARSAILIIGLGAVVTVVIRVWEATVFISRRIYLKNYAEIMARLASAAILVAWFVWMGPSVTVWMLVSVCLPLVLSLVFVIPLGAKGLGLKLRSVTIDRPEVRRALPFIAYITASQLGSLLFDNTDALVISALPDLGISQIAAYDVGTRWQRVVRPFVEAFILALSPGLVSLAARGDRNRLRDDVISHTRQLLLLGMIPTVAVACVARPFIHHWVGEQFVARSVPVMWVALASALLWGPGPYSARVLIAVSRLRFSTIGGIVAGLGNVVLSVFFVRVLGMGLLGIAMGTLVAVILWCDVALAIEVCAAVGLRPLTYFREVWVRPLLAMAVMLLLGIGLVRVWPPRSLVETLVQLAVSGTSMCVIAFAMGLTRSERSIVTSWTAGQVARLRSR
jgi:O-antigen/teichoic acid export membrane protein